MGAEAYRPGDRRLQEVDRVVDERHGHEPPAAAEHDLQHHGHEERRHRHLPVLLAMNALVALHPLGERIRLGVLRADRPEEHRGVEVLCEKHLCQSVVVVDPSHVSFGFGDSRCRP